jgi:hypothetical protein
VRGAPILAGALIAVAVVVVALAVHEGGHVGHNAQPAAAATVAARPHPAVTSAHSAEHVVVVSGSAERSFSLGHLSPQQLREFKYINTAANRVINTKVCQGPTRPPQPTSLNGSPPAALVSILGVLRRPATATDSLTLPHSARPFFPIQAQGVFVRYVRRALVKDGVSYYVIPISGVVEPPGSSRRCDAAQVAALRQELPGIPAADRASTVALQKDQLAAFRTQAHEPRDQICLFEMAQNGSGGGGCGVTAGSIKQGSEIQGTGKTYFGLVPDGVASVTLSYPAQNGKPAVSVTTRVADNIFAAEIGGASRSLLPPAATWRSTGGAVIKAIPGGGDINGTPYAQ